MGALVWLLSMIIAVGSLSLPIVGGLLFKDWFGAGWADLGMYLGVLGILILMMVAGVLEDVADRLGL